MYQVQVKSYCYDNFSDVYKFRRVVLYCHMYVGGLFREYTQHL